MGRSKILVIFQMDSIFRECKAPLKSEQHVWLEDNMKLKPKPSKWKISFCIFAEAINLLKKASLTQFSPFLKLINISKLNSVNHRK